MEKFVENHEPEEMESQTAEASPAERWQAFVARFREGMKQSSDWVENHETFSRTIQLPRGSFSLTRVGPDVMGPRSDEYECNLLHLFEELGMADDFESFRMICSTYGASAEKLAASLKPKQQPCPPMEIVLRLSILVPVREKKPRRMENKLQSIATLRIHPHQSDGSPYVRASFGEPEKFTGQLEIRISESIPDEESEE
jgi:hypothetical protein